MNRKSKNPELAQSMRLDVSDGLLEMLESEEIGSNAVVLYLPKTVRL